MTIERRKICVMSFYGKRREWAVYWNRKDVSATVWERVPFCDTKRTAREALALALEGRGHAPDVADVGADAVDHDGRAVSSMQRR